MDLHELRVLLTELNKMTDLSLQLLNFKHLKTTGTTYISREIVLNPDERLVEHVQSISDLYTSTSKSKLSNYQSIEDYDGTADRSTIYRIATDSSLVEIEYQLMLKAVSLPDQEINVLEFNANAYIISGNYTIDIDNCKQTKSIKLLSMKKPFTSFKNKFSIFTNDTFKEINEKILSLTTDIDVIIYDNYLYMLSLSAETLFNIERAHKSVCDKSIDLIINSNLVTNENKFKEIASSGHNPRKFISFNNKRFEQLNDKDFRPSISETFSIPIVEGKFDTSVDGTSEKIIKLLCNKGMIDPFEELPVEVYGTKKWT
ncbi:MAG: DUF4868 domain-containing protein [Clostridia bacterium]